MMLFDLQVSKTSLSIIDMIADIGDETTEIKLMVIRYPSNRTTNCIN